MAIFNTELLVYQRAIYEGFLKYGYPEISTHGSFEGKIIYMGVSIVMGGTAIWMVYFMENPI